jgi:hypothetical protein
VLKISKPNPPPRFTTKREESNQICAEVEDRLSQIDVAELSRTQISRMSCAELAEVVRTANLSFVRNDIRCHLDQYDHDTLERLAYLARRACQNRFPTA